MNREGHGQYCIPEIRVADGLSRLYVDGHVLAPMAFCARASTPIDARWAKAVAACGFDLFVLHLESGWQFEDGAQTTHSWEYTRDQAEAILREKPEALFLLRLSCKPSRHWFDSHPDDLVLFEGGSHTGYHPHSHGSFSDCRQVCYASEAYACDSLSHIGAAVGFVEASSFGHRVIGYHVEGGYCGEWNYLRCSDERISADHSLAFQRFYSRWLREKYGTDERLRAAWRDGAASLDSPRLPRSSELILSEGNLGHNGRFDREADVGNFLDPRRSQWLIDYYVARTEGTARTIERMSKAIKEMTGNRVLTGAFWGTMMDVSAATYGVCGPLFLENSPYVDYLTTPSQYYDRQPGGGSTFRMAVDSLRAHGKLWVNESDSRTHLAHVHEVNQFCQCWNLEQSRDVLNRDFAQIVCDGVYGWWYELGQGDHAFYDHPEIHEIFRRQQRLAHGLAEAGVGKHSEIAVIYDQESMFTHGYESMRDLLSWNRSQTLPRLGAPCDHFFHDDLELNRLGDYKLYIFLNCHQLTDHERTVIKAKVLRNGATVVWAYANGLINPDRQNALDLSNMEDLTGFSFGWELHPRPVTFQLTDERHDLTVGVPNRLLYGRMPRPLTGGFNFVRGESMIMDETLASPLIYLQEELGNHILGRFCANGHGAFGVRDFSGWRSVYIGCKILPVNILRRIAKCAGVHLYWEENDWIYPEGKNDIVYANDRIVAVVAAQSGEKRLLLPKNCKKVTDALTGVVVGSQTSVLTLAMHAGETRMLDMAGTTWKTGEEVENYA